MHRPIAPVTFAKLTGAVERVHDPYPRLGQPRRVEAAFFGQQPVVGSKFAKHTDDVVVRLQISLRFQPGGLPSKLAAHQEQPSAGLSSDRRSKSLIIQASKRGGHESPAMQLRWRRAAITRSAASSAVMVVVSTRSSGASGGS